MVVTEEQMDPPNIATHPADCPDCGAPGSVVPMEVVDADYNEAILFAVNYRCISCNSWFGTG